LFCAGTLFSCAPAPVKEEKLAAAPLPPPHIIASKNMQQPAPAAPDKVPGETPTPAKEPTIPPPVKDVVWKLKKGKLSGPGQVAPKLIAQIKDPKSGAVTKIRCWNYAGHSITEGKTTGEVGAGEVNIRRASSAKDKLCGADFAGKTDNLDIIEGYFAGIAGDYVVIEGADVGEGLPQFQLISLKTGKEIFKSMHNPNEEFRLEQRGHRMSLRFFAKIPVKCALADEGEACWKKVLTLSPPAKHTPMPDCSESFAKAKLAKTEDALVTIHAEVADLSKPKIRLLGGKATCQPAPL
jgi:hypothetical protein